MHARTLAPLLLRAATRHALHRPCVITKKDLLGSMNVNPASLAKEATEFMKAVEEKKWYTWLPPVQLSVLPLKFESNPDFKKLAYHPLPNYKMRYLGEPPKDEPDPFKHSVSVYGLLRKCPSLHQLVFGSASLLSDALQEQQPLPMICQIRSQYIPKTVETHQDEPYRLGLGVPLLNPSFFAEFQYFDGEMKSLSSDNCLVFNGDTNHRVVMRWNTELKEPQPRMMMYLGVRKS